MIKPNLIFNPLLVRATKFLLLPLLLAVSVSHSFGQYCASGAQFTGDSNVGLVIFGTINNNTGGICATYSDFTGTFSASVLGGQNVSISVQLGTCGGNYNRSGKVYIDYDMDGQFISAGEEIWAFGPTQNTQTFTTNITIPFWALPGTTRMRVVGVETGAPSNVGPCGSYTWGETEDYEVVIMAQTQDDMGVVGINSPQSGCSLTQNEFIEVDLVNFGLPDQSAVDIAYSINGGPPVVENTGPGVYPGASAHTYTFATPADFATPGTYTIQVWTDLSNDALHINDTATLIIESVPSISSYPYIQDFESGTGGWLTGTQPGSWAFGTPLKNVIWGAASGLNAWTTGGLGTGTYNANEDSWVIGPCFDFSSLENPWISMNIWWDSDFNSDGANIQYSTDFGTTWNLLGNSNDLINWYNSNTIWSFPGGYDIGWTGTGTNGSGDWQWAAHQLTGLGGEPSVLLRVNFGADGWFQTDGFAFDDVIIAEGPTVDAGPDRLICFGDSVEIEAPAGFASYQWTGGATTQEATFHVPGVVALQVTDSIGFFGTDTVFIDYSTPQVNLGPDTAICPGDTLFLDAENIGGTYIWHDFVTSQTYPVTDSGVYFVFVRDSVNCEAEDTISVQVLGVTQVELGPDVSGCVGTPIIFDASSGVTGATYLWNTSANTEQIEVTGPGQYIVEVNYPTGCHASDTVSYYVQNSPYVSLGPDRTGCNFITLNALNQGSSYLWSTGETTQIIQADMSSPYSVTVTNQNNCSHTDSVNITLFPEPLVNLGPDFVLCAEDQVQLDLGFFGPGTTYYWSTGSTDQSILLDTPGQYIGQVTDPNNCKVTDTVRVDGTSLSVNLGNNVVVCGQVPVVLNAANPGANYLWNTGETSQIITVDSSAIFSVSVTDNSGCLETDTIQVTQLPGVTAQIGAPSTDTLFQAVQFTDESFPVPGGWFWNFGDGNISTDQNPTHTYVAFGGFEVVLIVTNGPCQDTARVTINIDNYVGIENDLDRHLKVFPNPSEGVFFIELENIQAGPIQVEVFDVTGALIYTDTATGQSFQGVVDLVNEAPGIYMLQITNGESRVNRKLVKF